MDRSRARQASSPGLKLAWIILGASFMASLIASVLSIARTINWIRLRGDTVPSSYTVATQISEWIFGLSSAGLLVLTIVAILRGYRDR